MALTTKARWDKYNSYVGNYRGALAADIDLETQINVVCAVGVNSLGATVIGAGQTGVNGLMIVPVGIDIHGNPLDGGINTEAGDPSDTGKHGEITNFKPWGAPGNLGTTPAPAAGTNYYGHVDGSVLPSTGAGCVYVGHTVEADRLIVNVQDGSRAFQDNAPINLVGVGGTGTATLTWTPVKNATGYKIQKSTDGTTWAAGVPATATASTVVETGLTAGNANYFRVLATVAGVDSAYSNVARVTVL